MRILLFMGLLLAPFMLLAQSPVSVVPQPDLVTPESGVFTLRPTAKIVVLPSRNKRGKEIAVFLRDWLNQQMGLKTSLQTGSTVPTGAIVLALERHDDITHTEGYELRVRKDQIRISAFEEKGLFWGVQTLRQLFPGTIEGGNPTQKSPVTLSAITIKDSPKFGWRGSLLDVGRHFFPVSFVKRYIDLLSLYKMNVLHWHLTEDQGWRIEIKKYPKLTEVGAWRTEADGTRYGGFYTQKEIRDVVEYARLRNITVVPEIEMPGHSSAALVAYPQYSCTGETLSIPTTWGVFNDIYCVAKPETMTFLKDILDEVMTLFPSKYIHIGGDEAPKTAWNESELTQAFMREKGLKSGEELQSWFIKEIDAYVRSKGRTIIGWDEILEGGLASGATVQAWRDIEHARTATKLGNYVISSPTSHAYFDGQPDGLPLEKVHGFNPIPEGLTTEETAKIKGGEANIWTEYITTANFDAMVFPRLLAMSEALWTKSPKSYTDFKSRLDRDQYTRLRQLGVQFGPENRPLITMKPIFNPSTGNIQVQVERNVSGMYLYYTTDGTKPTPTSPHYTPDVIFDQPGEVQILPILNGEPLLRSVQFIVLPKHLAVGKKMALVHPPASRYTGTGDQTLTDGVQGSLSFSDGLWQGWNDHDFEAVLDLGKEQKVHEIALSTLQVSGSWILLPKEVLFSTSSDGQTWRTPARLTHAESPRRLEGFRYVFTQPLDGVSARYLRITAKRETLPDWHNGRGTPAWVFLDEVIVR
ncbi:MAG: family 20 glycosylhydrolase [Rhodothermia bacterium]|nr:family 20 glycosylhydrolase [Rhodothermia bacterium]